jgi:hypothetical protein
MGTIIKIKSILKIEKIYQYVDWELIISEYIHWVKGRPITRQTFRIFLKEKWNLLFDLVEILKRKCEINKGNIIILAIISVFLLNKKFEFNKYEELTNFLENNIDDLYNFLYKKHPNELRNFFEEKYCLYFDREDINKRKYVLEKFCRCFKFGEEPTNMVLDYKKILLFLFPNIAKKILEN